jgi:hypothetical protein
MMNWKRCESLFLLELYRDQLYNKHDAVHTDTSGSNMFIEWKTTGSQNNSWIIIQKDDDDLEDHLRDY